MGVKLHLQNLLIGKREEIEIEGGEYDYTKYGFLKKYEDGEIDPETVKELEEQSSGLDYRELGFGGKAVKFLYGGSIQTPYGESEWMGSPPMRFESL